MNNISVDIIIPGYFGPDTTLRAVQAVLRNSDLTRYDSKVILSEDGIDPHYLKLQEKLLERLNLKDRIVYIKRPERGGFVENCYTGIEYRESDYKVLLNSDTVVKPGWLDSMIELAQSDEKIAIVNPVSNNSPILTVPFPPGVNSTQMTQFITDFKPLKEDFIDVTTSVGFCMLIKSKYIKEYGFFDRIFGMGYCEESDLHFRYLSKGLRAVIAVSAFVYHRGEGSFGATRDTHRENNLKVFNERWQEQLRKDLVRFEEKSVLKRIRSESVIFGQQPKQFDLVFLLESDRLNNDYALLAHKLVNGFNELGYSANIVCTKEVTTEYENCEDRSYTPISYDQWYDFGHRANIVVGMGPEKHGYAAKLGQSSRAKVLRLIDSYEYTEQLKRSLLRKYDGLIYYGHKPDSLRLNPQILHLERIASLDLLNHLFKNQKYRAGNRKVLLDVHKSDLRDLILPKLLNQKESEVISSASFLSGEEIHQNITLIPHSELPAKRYSVHYLLSDQFISPQQLAELEMSGVSTYYIGSEDDARNALKALKNPYRNDLDSLVDRSDRVNIQTYVERIMKFEPPSKVDFMGKVRRVLGV